MYMCAYIHIYMPIPCPMRRGMWPEETVLGFPPSVTGMLGSSSVKKRASCCSFPFPGHQARHQDQV